MESEACIVRKKENSKYVNIYNKVNDTYEMHITDNRGIDNIFIINASDIDKVSQYFWMCTYCGKNGYKKPQVYCYDTLGNRIYLHRLILGVSSDKIVFINRDPFDYRLDNLCVFDSTSLSCRDRNKYNVIGMNNIRELCRNGRLVAYQVTFKVDGVYKAKSFNVRKIGTKDKALEQAKEFRDSLKRDGVLLKNA